MAEEWKWIVYQGHDFTGKYQVSDQGRIRSVDRHDRAGVFHAGQIIQQRTRSKQRTNSRTKYMSVTLWDNNVQVDAEVHRIVATMFLPRSDMQTYVNHKDGNGSNNRAENLEWCTNSENVRHSISVLGNDPRKWKSKAVAQKTPEGDLIRIWESAWEIQRQLGFCQVHISRCCRREKKSGLAYGFLWDFAEGRDEHDGQKKRCAVPSEKAV